MHFTVYKITNIINNKIYIGAHKTSDLEDGYMGSGTYLKRAQRKYGIENFSKEILFDFISENEMMEKELELVNEEFVTNKQTYNLTLGGNYGSWLNFASEEDKISFARAGAIANNKNGGNIKASKAHHDLLKTDIVYRENWLKKLIDGCKVADTWTDRKHTDLTKSRMKETHKNNKHAQGEKNSQYGTCWIYSLEHKKSSKIKLVDLDIWLNLGWVKGRKLKFN